MRNPHLVLVIAAVICEVLAVTSLVQDVTNKVRIVALGLALYFCSLLF